MTSVCGLSACSEQIITLKNYLSRLPMTASNLKENNVGKIICQRSTESSRQGTCICMFCFSGFSHHTENKVICTLSRVLLKTLNASMSEFLSYSGIDIYSCIKDSLINLISSSYVMITLLLRFSYVWLIFFVNVVIFPVKTYDRNRRICITRAELKLGLSKM